MRTRAAVAMAAGQPLQIMEVNLADPREGEVLVEIKATGICHTDYYTLSGADPEGIFPAILGHEGAGVVVKAGSSDKAQALLGKVWPLLARGLIKPVIHSQFAAADAARAHSLMESNEHIGKIVLTWDAA